MHNLNGILFESFSQNVSKPLKVWTSCGVNILTLVERANDERTKNSRSKFGKIALHGLDDDGEISYEPQFTMDIKCKASKKNR